MTINEIYNLSYKDAVKQGSAVMVIKGHNCVLVDFKDYFGYSMLVFNNGRHIYYADDFELDHRKTAKEKGQEGLKAYYIRALNRRLFTDEELMGEIKSYDEYCRKDYFLRNYWIQRYDHKSAIVCGERSKTALRKARSKLPYYNPVSLCYVADKEIVGMSIKFQDHLMQEYRKLQKSEEGFREMIRYELENHEACITCEYGDALYALGLEFDRLEGWQQKIVKDELRYQICKAVE